MLCVYAVVRFVVYIDDLDRCSDGKSVMILEAVQLLFNETPPEDLEDSLIAEFGGRAVRWARLSCFLTRLWSRTTSCFSCGNCPGCFSCASGDTASAERSFAQICKLDSESNWLDESYENWIAAAAVTAESEAGANHSQDQDGGSKPQSSNTSADGSAASQLNLKPPKSAEDGFELEIRSAPPFISVFVSFTPLVASQCSACPLCSSLITDEVARRWFGVGIQMIDPRIVVQEIEKYCTFPANSLCVLLKLTWPLPTARSCRRAQAELVL